MTFLVPILIIGMYALIAALTIKGGDTITLVNVLDESGVFANKFQES